jgi:hypothetical protein
MNYIFLTTQFTQIVPSIVLHALPLFRIARDPTTAAALADPYLGQSIGPVPGYGVSFSCVLFIFVFLIFHTFNNLW